MLQSRVDPLSYTSHGRIKVLLAPLRPIKRSRFEQLASIVRSVTDVRLEDVAVPATKEHNFFDPRRIPQGRILFDFVSEIDQEHSYLESFEASRQVFAILLIGDGTETHLEEDVKTQHQQSVSATTSALLANVFLFDGEAFVAKDWPQGTYAIDSENNSSSNHPGPALRDALVGFTSSLLVKMNDLYSSTRERTNIQSPYDPASVLIRPQPQRMSSFALGDAQISPSPSPTPGQERSVRNSLGPGILASSERLKVISNGRAAKLCGDLLLICGLCNEAMRLYSEAAAIARANNDYLWQGAALEGIGVCIVLFTFLDMSFQIPTIAQVNPSSTTAAKKPERKSISSNRGDVDLVDYLPDLHASILSLYQKSTSTQSDQVPALVLSESSLRMANLLAAIHRAGALDRRALDHLVLGTELSTTGQAVAAYPPRAEIAAWAMRAYHGPVQSLSLPDKVYILSGLASIHGAIGFRRRRALFLREILLTLIPALVQARVAGAAGMGIHPAASLALSENQVNNFSREVLLKTQQTGNSLASLLEDVAQSYGVPQAESEADMLEIILGGHGWGGLRNAVLKDCMSICEAVPDFAGVLKFSARTLEFHAAKMDRDEQVRLVANIPRITAISKRVGLLDIEADYWDNFLVRKIEVHTRLSSLPVKQNPQVLAEMSGASGEKSAFLYNPYERKSAEVARPTMIQAEQTDVQITLQNPFLFDIEAVDIEILTDSSDLMSSKNSAYIKAGTTTTVILSCTPKTAGQFRILGCDIKMSGCRTKSFFTRHAPTRQEIESWHVANGGLFRQKQKDRSDHASDTDEAVTCSPDVVLVDVLPQVPVLSHRLSSKADNINVTVLEGESSTVQFKLENTSPLPVNFLAFSMHDSTEKLLLQAINSRTKQPHEIYELETFLYKRKAFAAKTRNSKCIPPYSIESFDIDVFGKRGLTGAQITINYGHLPSLAVDNQHQHGTSEHDQQIERPTIYTRQLKLPIKCIIQHALDFIHCDILPIAFPSLTPLLAQRASDKFANLISSIPAGQISQYQVLILDVRNSQPQTMTLEISFENGDETFTSSIEVSGLSQERMLVPLRRAQLSPDQLMASIPSLSERQFIVSSVPRDVEAADRETFWSREDFLSRLTATWKSGSRQGSLETRSITFTKRMVDNYLLPRLQLQLSIVQSEDAVQPNTLRAHERGELSVVITNHTKLEKGDDRVMLRVIVTDQVTQTISTQFRILGASQRPITIACAPETAMTTTTTDMHKVNFFAFSEGKYVIQASLAHISSQDKLLALSPKLEVEVVH